LKVNGQFHASVPLPPGKDRAPSYPFHRREERMGARTGLDDVEKILLELTGTFVIQAAASCYTD
jgi:hypothetical protein